MKCRDNFATNFRLSQTQMESDVATTEKKVYDLEKLFPIREDGKICLKGLLDLMKENKGIPADLADQLGLGQPKPK